MSHWLISVLFAVCWAVTIWIGTKIIILLLRPQEIEGIHRWEMLSGAMAVGILIVFWFN